MGSQRLSGKHLLEIDGVPIFSFLLERIKFAFADELDSNEAKIIVATADEDVNVAFERFSSPHVDVFYGSENNIPLRQLQAAECYDFERIVSVDGDDILCSTFAMRTVDRKLQEGAAYVKTEGLPLGMNAVAYSKAFLTESVEGHRDSVLETGWGRIFDDSALVTLKHSIPGRVPDIRFTLDYEQDFEFFRRIIEHFGKDLENVSDETLVQFAEDSEAYMLNSMLVKEYAENFQAGLEKDIENSEESSE